MLKIFLISIDNVELYVEMQIKVTRFKKDFSTTKKKIYYLKLHRCKIILKSKKTITRESTN